MKKLALLASLAAMLAMAGCGGSSGDGSSARPYTGETAAAAVDETSKVDLAEMVTEGMVLAYEPFESGLLEMFPDIRFFRRSLNDQVTQSYSLDFTGSCGGAMSIDVIYTEEFDPETGDSVLKVTQTTAYAGYCNETYDGPYTDGMIYNGSISINATMEDTAASQTENITYAASNATIFDDNGTPDDLTDDWEFYLNFTSTQTYDYNSDTGSGALNGMVSEDDAGAVRSWAFENFAFTDDLDGLAFTGRAYLSDYGYVDVTTDSFLGYDWSYGFVGGAVILTGAAPTEARVTYWYPEPHYGIELWDAGAADWGPQDLYDSYWSPMIF